MKGKFYFRFLFLFFAAVLSLSSCGQGVKNNDSTTGEGIVSSGERKKILYVDSYHSEFPWSRGIASGICSVLGAVLNDDGTVDDSKATAELRIFHMDTKRHLSEEYSQEISLQAKALIEDWKPDAVIASDDNAAKYLIAPYYIDSEIPFVFCGINWDASVYGLPASNVTGMIEVALIRQLVDQLAEFTPGKRVGFLKGDSLTSRKESLYIEKVIGQNLVTELAVDYRDWQEKFISLQDRVDILLVGYPGALPDWDEDLGHLKSFIMESTRIPTGAWDTWLSEMVLITYANQAEEQGEWAASRALEILDGKSPADIPVVENKRAAVYLNLALAKALGIRFPMELIERSHMVNDAVPDKKILYVNSYHEGYVWSDDIEKGLKKALDASGMGIDLKIFRMDTKENRSEDFIKQKALEVKKLADEWKPDLIVGSDDNFVKYVVVPYYRNSAIPVVFCGVNWDASGYHLPDSHITGMIEVDPVDESINLLRTFARGNRLGVLGLDDDINRRLVTYAGINSGLEFDDASFVDDFDKWKSEYIRLQKDVDVLLLMNPVGIRNWDKEQAVRFIHEHARIPSGITVDGQIEFALLGNVKVAEEQGWWAGKTAIEILSGKDISQIPPVKNSESKILINMTLAGKMGIVIPSELLEKAVIWNENTHLETD